jgi:excisionase family DNA binding protein
MTRMSISTAASRLNVSVDSVRRRLRSGVIPGTRDERGQWWLELPDTIQPEPQPPSVDQRLVLGMAIPGQTPTAGQDGLIEMLQDRIDDLLVRLDSSERERRDDKVKAASERDRLLTLIENLSRQSM